MLLELTIKNFAIVDELRVELGPGLNVLTGETGAGKSIIVDAVMIVLGSRAGPEFIRVGADLARIEAVFDLPSNTHEALQTLLAEYDLETDDGTLILTRELRSGGRSVCRVNARTVPLGALQQVGRLLVDIHSQTEHLSLVRADAQLEILDAYGGLTSARRAVAALVVELRRVRESLVTLLRDERELARRADLLKFQAEEIEDARLEPDEEESLLQERLLLTNTERLAAAAAAAHTLLYEGGDEQTAATDVIGQSLGFLHDLASVDKSLQEHVDVVEQAQVQLQEVARALRAYRDAVEFNPDRLVAVEERLELIRRLKRKYGGSIAEILAFGVQARAELATLDRSEERLEELRADESRLLETIGAAAGQLSAARAKAGERLTQAIVRELADLNMSRAQFKVELGRVPDPEGVPVGGERYAVDTRGVDRVELQISPNPGIPLKPLSKIASGGEMSRIMLALKTILSRADAVSTLIFDEIEIGVGGRSGQVLGEKLAQLATDHQVLCVTHLPQIAAFGDRHFTVSKHAADDSTVTSIRQLGGRERLAEVAAMLGSTGEAALEAAAELLATADRLKATAVPTR